MVLPPASPLCTTADFVPTPATTTVSFLPDKPDSIRTITTVTVKIHQNIHRNEKYLPPHREKLLVFVGVFHKF